VQRPPEKGKFGKILKELEWCVGSNTDDIKKKKEEKRR